MKQYFQKTTSAAPLAVFRIALGLLIFVSIVRFWSKGWIAELYIQPKYFFTFYGFEFISPLGEYSYILFAVCAVSALFVASGLYYRISSIVLFLSFTYIELIDKSTYLNHYYFVSMVCLMMIFLPANSYFSLDAKRDRSVCAHIIPQWTIDCIKLFVCIVYIFAGLAKVNSDWLLHAQPLKIWLPAKNDLPLIGFLFDYPFVAYLFAWLGCLYDLSIPFLLIYRITRPFAYGTVVIFHLLTAVLFPIGMFPYIMMATALIFFPPGFHQSVLNKVRRWIKGSSEPVNDVSVLRYEKSTQHVLIAFFSVFFLFQFIVPVRHLLYPGELFWTEQGYRFSWRVMLIEKAGHAQFIVKDSTGSTMVVDNKEFLTPLQEKMMATQPDMILQYAHILRDYYVAHGLKQPQVYVDSYVALNGRLGKSLIDPRADLAKEKDSFEHKPWILPFEDEIKGF